MNNVLLSVKVAYDDMGRAEKRIADWITENYQKMFSMSITELAAECSCGEATIVRFARRLGLDGYQGLKIALAMEEGQKRISGSITGDDTPFEVFEKVIEDIYCSLEMTKRCLSLSSLPWLPMLYCRRKRWFFSDLETLRRLLLTLSINLCVPV